MADLDSERKLRIVVLTQATISVESVTTGAIASVKIEGKLLK